MVTLSKGESVSLTKDRPQLRRVIVACGWRAKQGNGPECDLDVSAAGVDASGKVPNAKDPKDMGYQAHFVFANHRLSSDGSIRFMNDNRTGGGSEERIHIDLTRVASGIDRIKIAVVIWWALLRRQKFSDIRDAYIRIIDADTHKEIARFNLSNSSSKETLAVFGELCRDGANWNFHAVGEYMSPRAYRHAHGIRHRFELNLARYED